MRQTTACLVAERADILSVREALAQESALRRSLSYCARATLAESPLRAPRAGGLRGPPNPGATLALQRRQSP
jgi:hypothetical protein